MPTVLRGGAYRFYFYSHEPLEPPACAHRRDRQSAKFWLQPVALARNLGFSAAELGRIEVVVVAHSAELLEAWHEFHRS